MTTPTANTKVLQIDIDDVIGPSYWGEKTVSYNDIRRQLKDQEFDELLVRINSPGGDAYHSIAIYNLFAALKQQVSIEVVGLAASGATIVMMSGDKICMAANAEMMIHNASTIAYGNRHDFDECARYLQKVDTSMAQTYAARTKGDLATIVKQLDAETWFNAEEAKAAGFVDVILPFKEVKAEFDLSAFSKVPERVSKRFGRPSTSLSIACGPLRPSQMEQQLSPEKEIEPMSQSTTTPAPTAATPAPAPVAAAPVPVAAAPAAPTAADVTKAKDEGAAAAKAAEKERSSKIIALCKQAGKPDEALALVESDLTVVDVQAKLFESMCKDRVPVGEEGGSGAAPPKADADAEAKKEYKANPHLAKVMTEAEFIAQKKRDEDHGYVTPKTVAAVLAGAN